MQEWISDSSSPQVASKVADPSVAQLLAGHQSTVEAVITHRAPLAVQIYLQSSVGG